MTREGKSKIVSDLVESFKDCDGVVIAEYKGLSVRQLDVLRHSAKEQNVRVQVVKNTLANLALQGAGKNGISLKDTNIFLWGDQLSVCKVASKFEEKHEVFKIKSGHIDGDIASVEKIRALSKMPSRDELIAMLLQVWNAPIQNFTIGLNALKEKKEQSE